jgi:putative flippase GtrA
MASRDTSRQLLRFTAIGAVAFVVDASVLLVARNVLGLGLYLGRVCSFLIAATFTWALNRRFTFADADTPPVSQWGRFLAANAVGGGVNYAVYAVLVTLVPVVAAYPVLGVAAGSLAGLVFNFTASKKWVFRKT